MVEKNAKIAGQLHENMLKQALLVHDLQKEKDNATALDKSMYSGYVLF